MTLMLTNESKKEAITLRYGDGLNKALQINPGEQKECPIELRRSLLNHYLATFKDLKLIENSAPVKVEGQDNGQIEETDATGSEISEEEDQTEDGEESSNDDLPDEGDSEAGDADSTAGESEEGQSQEGEEVVDPEQDGESQEDDSQEGSEEGKSVLTEKELSKLSATEIKDLAVKLGIEVTEESTKKALIPVILDKQGK